jgi:tRNA A-37 threonylcarbamoyl transferase component Bud32/tetratricopeptide (TPR) repeat protein
VRLPAPIADPLEKGRLLQELQQVMFGRGQPLRLHHYAIGRRLGSGAMGVVYEARDTRLGRDVAIKLLHAHGDDEDPEAARRRLRREARTIGRIVHPNVVAVYDVGVFADRVYVVMELVRGPSLAGWLRAADRDAASILSVFTQAARGLQAAHAAGVVHRDFKPSNVQIGDDGRVRVLDFGLARPVGARSASSAAEPFDIRDHGKTLTGDASTRSGTLAGTPWFLAPELLLGSPADAAGDQYAFCVALHEALHGVPPFDPEAMLRSKLDGSRLHPPANPKRVPPRTLRAIRRGLDPDPRRRFPSMGALLDALEPRPARRRALSLAAVGASLVLVAFGASGSARSNVSAATPSAQAEDPEAIAGVTEAIARVAGLREAGELQEAEAAARAALDLALSINHGPSIARARLSVARALGALAQTDEAAAALEAAYADAVECGEDRVRAHAAMELGRIAIADRNDRAAGARWLGDARAALQRSPVPELQSNLALLEAMVARMDGDLQGAARAARAAVASAREARSGTLAYALHGASTILLEARELEEASRAIDEAIDVARRTLGPGHRHVAEFMLVRAGIEAVAATISEDPSMHARAAQSSLDAVAALEAALGPEHYDTLNARLNAGIVLSTAGRNEDARVLLEHSLEGLERLRGPDDTGVAIAHENLGIVLLDLGERQAAAEHLQRAVVLQELRLGADHPTTARARNFLAEAEAALPSAEETVVSSARGR